MLLLLLLIFPVVVCPPLSGPVNGAVSVPDASFGGVATYTCNTGYDLTGAVNRSCQSDGTWSDSPPTCVESKYYSFCDSCTRYYPSSFIVQCPELPLPDNGELVYSGFSFSSTVLYMCNEGYESSGPIERVCQLDSTWSGEAPTCEQSK